jgi:phosphate transport system substrate-binding protein
MSRTIHCVAAVFLLFVSAAACSFAGEPAAAPADPNLIRVWGYNGLSAQLLRWEAAYQKRHPEIRFENQLHGPAAVMAGLYDGVADFALMGREIWPVEAMAYRWVYQQQPFGVMVSTSGLNAPDQAFTPVVIVNAKNPLTSISLGQLDGIYGGAHLAAPANIRTWGELGLTGEWASRAIDVYGFGPEDSLGVFFRHDVLHSDFKPNPASHLLSDHDSDHVAAATRIRKAVAEDTYAIGYANLPANAAVKVLPLVAAAGTIAAQQSTLSTHYYPLTRSIFLYFRRVPDHPIDPKVDAFVRFVLSPEAQAMVHPQEGFLPLTPGLTEMQIKKLDAPMPANSAPQESDQ